MQTDQARAQSHSSTRVLPIALVNLIISGGAHQVRQEKEMKLQLSSLSSRHIRSSPSSPHACQTLSGSALQCSNRARPKSSAPSPQIIANTKCNISQTNLMADWYHQAPVTFMAWPDQPHNPNTTNDCDKKPTYVGCMCKKVCDST